MVKDWRLEIPKGLEDPNNLEAIKAAGWVINYRERKRLKEDLVWVDNKLQAVDFGKANRAEKLATSTGFINHNLGLCACINNFFDQGSVLLGWQKNNSPLVGIAVYVEKKWRIKPLGQSVYISCAKNRKKAVSEASVIYYVLFGQEQKEVRRFDIKRKL